VVVSSEAEGDLRVVWLERPEKLNALTLPMVDQLAAELESAAHDGSVAGVIVAGRGRSFCAGVDLAEFAEGTPDSGRHLIEGLKRACAAARLAPKPFACAVQGHCLGAAFELALACDFRVATPGAVFGLPEVKLGLPSVIDAALLQHYVGLGRAREMLLTGEPIHAEPALAIGLVNRVVAAEELIAAAAQLMRRVLANDARAVAVQKRLIGDWLDRGLSEAIEASVEDLVAAFEGGRPRELATRRLRK
jgi:enoyl-CoA hydratase/carnithine racemase